MLLLFYYAVVGSLLNYGMQAWYGKLSVQLKSQLARLVKTAMKVMGVREYTSLQCIKVSHFVPEYHFVRVTVTKKNNLFLCLLC